MDKEIAKKPVVMIIPRKGFRDAEYFIPREIFEKAGLKVITASNEIGAALGADGGETEAEILLESVEPECFSAIVFVGGPGTLKALDNEKSYSLARKTAGTNRILAAICIAPLILAKAGALRGKKATVWASGMDKSQIRLLEKFGAVYGGPETVKDGCIITAPGAEHAGGFANKIVESLNN